MNYPSDKLRIEFPIADSGFTPETGFSYVTIVTPEGRFTGTAQVHPYDMENYRYSSYSGQDIAYLRAHIEYLKHLKAMTIFCRREMMRTWATSKKKNPTSESLKKRVDELTTEIADYRIAIQEIKDIIVSKINGLEAYYDIKAGFEAKNK